ncbi:MAG: ATP-binding protein [Nanoarchaeota archaeon]|jgi:putative ATP-dependent endonuclease of OLD family|nr:ATP-binding protein [Nanoarchaeota archaeon]
MAKIHTLKIKNFRCLKKIKHVFKGDDLICLIGRGDSGKTTILNAISAVLSPNWNYSFYDTDFHNGKIKKSIKIEVTLYDLPTELLSDSKFGLYKRLINKDNKIVDDILSEDLEDCQDALTIKLVVNNDLEPRWYVVNNREQEDIEIRANDRARLNVFIVSDYIDRHFSWSRGNPLYSLLKQLEVEIDTDKIITEANRKAKKSIKKSESFSSFDTVIDNVKSAASNLGLSAGDLEAFVDFKNTLIKEGSISLHNGNIPFRLKGKGTKRLLSIAIQLELAKQGGIILIDEIEQGLEPDRAKFLAKYLKDNNQGQVFFTTHSSNVLVELSAKHIFLRKNNSKKLYSFKKDFQGCLRNNPEAFFAKRVIVCEGATEVGICRALNNYRIKNKEDNLSVLGVSYVDGNGDNFINYCLKLNKAGFDVCAFCDSDKKEINDEKENLRGKGIFVVDCEENKSIEEQIFSDLPWEKIKKLVKYAIKEKSEQSILDVTGKETIEDLIGEENDEIRLLLGNKSKKKGWYKRIDHGEVIGKYWFNSIPNLEGTTLKTEYDNLSNWINE